MDAWNRSMRTGAGPRVCNETVVPVAMAQSWGKVFRKAFPGSLPRFTVTLGVVKDEPEAIE